MTGALSVVEPGSPIQLVLATLVMLTFTLITLKLAPYRQKADDWTTFLVSLVITANTQAGFVLLMDKENVPHNFNPENIEVMLLTMNIGVLIVQLLNLVMIKWGCWVKLKAAPCCQKAFMNTETNLHKITPSSSRDDPGDEDESAVERLMTTFTDSEDRLKEKSVQRRNQHIARVQERLAARREVRQTRTLTRAKVFEGIDAAATTEVLALMDYERYEKGSIICDEGAVADRFYIIVAGHCDVLQVRKGGADDEETKSIRVGVLNHLDVMGENALIVGDGRRHVRSATVIAKSDVVQTLELQRSDFEQLVETGMIGQEILQRMHSVQQERRDVCKALQQSHALQQTDLFRGLDTDAISKIIDVMEFRKFEAGTHLVIQDEAASELMVIMQGSATVYRHDAMVRRFGKFDIIGEIAVLPGEHVRGATVTAEGGEVTALVLCKDRYCQLKAEGVISDQIHERARRKSEHYLRLDLAASQTVGQPPPPEL